MTKTVLHNRYILHTLLGRGAMGVVHCATDRLTGQTLALKQIKIQPQDLVFGSHRGLETNTSLHLALVRCTIRTSDQRGREFIWGRGGAYQIFAEVI